MTLTTINLAALGDTINLSTEVTGTLGTTNLPTIPVTKGGTNLTSGNYRPVFKIYWYNDFSEFCRQCWFSFT
jgi:hypothetical protein